MRNIGSQKQWKRKNRNLNVAKFKGILNMIDHYKILGIKRDASLAEIKKVGRKLSLIHHPDKGGDQEKFKAINEAYSTLQDSDKKRIYDASLRAFEAADIDREDKVIVNEYALAFMSTQNLKENVIEFKCEENGFRYRVLGLDNQEKTGLIAWDKLPDSFPRNNEAILTSKNKLVFAVLKITSKAGHTLVNRYLPAGDTSPFSLSYRKEHESLLRQYEQAPLAEFSRDVHIKPFSSDLYHLEEKYGQVRNCHDIFTFVREKAVCLENKIPPLMAPLTTASAIKVLTDFLSGCYYGQGLTALNKYLATEINKKKSLNKLDYELPLCEGIYGITSMAEKFQKKEISAKDMIIGQDNLLAMLIKITDFSKNSPEMILAIVIPLFHNKLFRNLYAYALHLFWCNNDGLFNPETLTKFSGLDATKELLKEKRGQLENNSDNENLLKVIQYTRLLYNFEKDMQRHDVVEVKANDCRKHAFHMLDWMPALMATSGTQILINTLLQLGIRFQLISRLEENAAIRMADEQLAFKLYLNAISLGRKSTPDVELYTNTQALRYMHAFQYQHESLEDILLAYNKRTLLVANVFPFLEGPQSNIAFFKHDNRMIHLMRQLLNAMLKIYHYNKTHNDKLPIDHSAVTIMSTAYDSCLNNWFREEHDPEAERLFRVELMGSLLAENGWKWQNVERNLLSPWVLINRDKEGWLMPSPSCRFPEEAKSQIFRAIRGAEVNRKTGQIDFFLDRWNPSYPEHQKAFTPYDIQEILQKNLGGAIFSLDQVDPLKPNHPFNIMHFSPSQLCNTDLLNTMLMTDYILKFLTIKQEVSGQYPFDQRPVENMIQHMPEYLRKIIEDFRHAQHSEAIHRFWIEAEETEVALDEQQDEGVTRIALGKLRMVVKKHKMKRDIHGELVDDGNEDEGWPIYVLTPQQMRELYIKRRVINSHAMIFINGDAEPFYWENNTITRAKIPENYRETLNRLYKQPRDSDGKIIQNSVNMPLIYRVTKAIANKSGMPHRYSPEFIFAHEFTTHYDEFGQYLPEFLRLKELSKISTVIRILDGIRQSNQESLEALNQLLSASPSLFQPETDTYKLYRQSAKETWDQVMAQFQEWRTDLSSYALQNKWGEKLNRIKNEIGTLVFDRNSPQVTEYCQCWYAELCRSNPGISSTRIWNEVINPKIHEVVRDLSDSKRKDWRDQLYKSYSERLLTFMTSTDIYNAIDLFLDGDITQLQNELTLKEKNEAAEQVQKQYPASSTTDIASALDYGNDAAAMRVAYTEVCRQLKQQQGYKSNLASEFKRINFGKHEEKVDLTGKCYWVPASVRHEVRKDATGLSRHSFFRYGGVSLQSKTTYLYQQVDAQGGHVKFGVAVNPATRYSAEQLNGGRLHVLVSGSRAQMLQTERFMHSIIQPGPGEGQQTHNRYAAHQQGWRNIFGT